MKVMRHEEHELQDIYEKRDAVVEKSMESEDVIIHYTLL